MSSEGEKNPVQETTSCHSQIRSLHVGLTGGIACGKSHISKFLTQLGGTVLDADQVARKVVRPGCPAYRKIVDHFGQQVILLNGELDRKLLSSIIFADPAARRILNGIVHPYVAEEVDGWLKKNETVCPPIPLFVEAALLVENGRYRKFDYLVVAYCKPEIQIRRIMKRDLVTEEMAELKIRAQMPIEEKKKAADFLIDTSGPYRQTQAQIVEIFTRLLQAPLRIPSLNT
jgi:dephospho-CoA kinase